MRLATVGIPAALSLFAATFLLSGCSNSFAPGQGGPSESTFAIRGNLYGGQQPIASATISVYAANTAAYAGPGIAASAANASVVGATTTTDTNGYFTFPSTTACTTGSQMYLYSAGGNPGQIAGTNNAAATLMAALGTCTDGLLQDTVGTNTRIVMNEASTIGMAYAVAGFATDPLHIGAPSATDTLAKTGISNAFATAGQLYSLPYGSTTAESVTPGGNGTVPQAELNTLANILAACVNTTSAAAPACSSAAATKGLFYYATSTGVAGAAAAEPADTATAAINIAHFPGSNVAALFALTGSTIIPFFPALTAAPNDFTVQLIFTGGGLAASNDYTLHGIAVDAAGNIWRVNGIGANTLSEFNSLGVPVSATGYTGNGLNEPYGLAIDTTGNVWVSNISGNSLSEFTAGGAAVTGSPFSDASLQLNEPTDIAFDAGGNLWVTNFNGGTAPGAVNKLTSAPAFVASTAPSTTGLGLAIALQSGTTSGTNGYCFVPDLDYNTQDYFTYNDTTTSTSYQTNASGDGSLNIAVDASNRYWATQNGAAYVSRGTSTNARSTASTIQGTGEYYVSQGAGIALDGAGNVWVSDYANGAFVELSTAGTVLSLKTYEYPAVGNAPSKAKGSARSVIPGPVAVDGSGNVWYGTYSDATIREIVGAGTPVATPISYGTANSKLATKP